MTVQNQATQLNTEDLLARIAELETRVEALEQAPAQDIEDRLAMVVFSGDLDKALAAFIIATGAAAMGLEVSMFFTFWGLSVVRKGRSFEGKNAIQKAFGALLPAGGDTLHLSKMDFFGAGAALMRKIMRENDVTSLDELVALAQDLGVRMVACEMSRELLGIRDDELLDGLELGGVATFIGDASRSKITLFI
ncbi:hypothetical protein ARMA_2302 [Ardenticatena maritima]|uniref:Peroxiredoxin family protein n=1 Tax=Ardenticatena maritima TaxID=872965 RepID=A0A0M8KAN5_9CHLR|nr:DsrE/DsrF/DrsH-like family protein [Ardenticatena maritima]KPL89380.1 hypothetical protein SE16_02680 [Ardenticatena maritima]GAP63879.1 hypothetical protein ARMA_2302 [Ardenticatena maritima]